RQGRADHPVHVFADPRRRSSDHRLLARLAAACTVRVSTYAALFLGLVRELFCTLEPRSFLSVRDFVLPSLLRPSSSSHGSFFIARRSRPSGRATQLPRLSGRCVRDVVAGISLVVDATGSRLVGGAPRAGSVGADAARSEVCDAATSWRFSAYL